MRISSADESDAAPSTVSGVLPTLPFPSAQEAPVQVPGLWGPEVPGSRTADVVACAATPRQAPLAAFERYLEDIAAR